MASRFRVGRMKGAVLAAVVAGSALGGLAMAQGIPRAGYLGDAADRTIDLLGPPPAAGSPRAEADRAIFRATRAMKGTPRWTMAQADFNPRAVVGNMSCAIGVRIDPATLPATMKLILRMAPDYPSGHSAWGWAVALVLAEMLPERADAILVRGRAVGEGRAICGVHNYSSIVAGQTVGAAIVAAEHRTPAFQADLAAAKAELQAALKAGPALEGCEAEAKMLATPAW